MPINLLAHSIVQTQFGREAHAEQCGLYGGATAWHPQFKKQIRLICLNLLLVGKN